MPRRAAYFAFHRRPGGGWDGRSFASREIAMRYAFGIADRWRVSVRVSETTGGFENLRSELLGCFKIPRKRGRPEPQWLLPEECSPRERSRA